MAEAADIATGVAAPRPSLPESCAELIHVRQTQCPPLRTWKRIDRDLDASMNELTSISGKRKQDDPSFLTVVEESLIGKRFRASPELTNQVSSSHSKPSEVQSSNDIPESSSIDDIPTDVTTQVSCFLPSSFGGSFWAGGWGFWAAKKGDERKVRCGEGSWVVVGRWDARGRGGDGRGRGDWMAVEWWGYGKRVVGSVCGGGGVAKEREWKRIAICQKLTNNCPHLFVTSFGKGICDSSSPYLSMCTVVRTPGTGGLNWGRGGGVDAAYRTSGGWCKPERDNWINDEAGENQSDILGYYWYFKVKKLPNTCLRILHHPLDAYLWPELKHRIDRYLKGDMEVLPSIFEGILARKLSGKHDDTDDELMEEFRSKTQQGEGHQFQSDEDLTESDSDEDLTESDEEPSD
uniref:Uncharacterized protein n=1 Tax=Chenopodium quinoa TaxID=63459 RepID=A0A803MIG6_CHEQI